MAIPEIRMERWTDLWANMPKAVEAKQPAAFESLGQNQGLMVYRTKLPAGAKGMLRFEKLHDYAQVFVDGKCLGVLDRRAGQRTIEIPGVDNREAVLEVLVEGMGHINYHIAMEQDRKGILGAVKVGDIALTGWQMFPFPLSEPWVAALPKSPASSGRPGGIFRGTFTLDTVADTYVDMSKYTKGVVWLNGHNLGRYWSIGPQKRLYCPAPWLTKGINAIVVLDLHQTEAQPIAGAASAR
jgi:beta-galactosidase